MLSGRIDKPPRRRNFLMKQQGLLDRNLHRKIADILFVFGNSSIVDPIKFSLNLKLETIHEFGGHYADRPLCYNPNGP
jgi:hypothetical protein